MTDPRYLCIDLEGFLRSPYIFRQFSGSVFPLFSLAIIQSWRSGIGLLIMATETVSLAVTETTQSAVPFAITTTYTAPTQCAQSVGGLTMLGNDEYRVWLNAILPVPGTTVTSCYPSQYISSFLLQTGGVTQAAFSPLVCPAGYATQGPFTSNYIACCPR